MRECRGILWNATGGSAIIFENNKGMRGTHTVRVLDNSGNRIVWQIPLQRGLPIILIPVRERWAEQRLHRWERHGLDTINNRVAKRAKRFEDPFAIGDIAAVAGDHS